MVGEEGDAEPNNHCLATTTLDKVIKIVMMMMIMTIVVSVVMLVMMMMMMIMANGEYDAASRWQWTRSEGS